MENEDVKYCKKCGNKLKLNDVFCPKCGYNQNDDIVVNNNTSNSDNSNLRTCPHCGSTNISYQRETTGSFGGAKTTISKGHGCMWWCLIGWWWWMIKFIWEFLKVCMTGGLSLFFRKKKASAKTVNFSKNINKTVAVCQNCGHTWKV